MILEVKIMIEFNGYLTDDTEKYFYRKTVKFGQFIIVTSMALLLPGAIALAFYVGFDIFLKIFGGISAVLLITTIIPKSKKGRHAYTPKRIFTDGESITCISDKYAETKFIEDAKIVYDKGEFYDIIFPIGNYSEKFVCQKNLLVKGTIEEFEALFEGKIERRY